MENRGIKYGWVIVATGGLTIFSSLGLGRFAYSMLLPSMGEALGLGYDQMGFISTGNFTGYLVAVALAPYFMNRIGPRRTITSALVTIAMCMLIIGRSREFLHVFFLYFLTGIGSGLSNVPMVVLASHWFSPSARGRATGVMLSGNGVAIIFAGFLIPALNYYLGPGGWSTGWVILGSITMLIALAAGVFLRDSPDQGDAISSGENEKEAPHVSIRNESKSSGWILAQLGILYFIFGFTYMIYGTFIVTTMVSERGMAEAVAGRFWAWVGFFSIFSGPLFGAVSDRIGRKGGFIAVFTVQTAAYGLASVDLGAGVLYLSVVLYGISAWSIPTIMAASVADYLGLERAAAGFSMVTFIFAAGQALGPSAAGMLAEGAGSFSGAYVMAAAATGIGILAASLMRPPPAVSTGP